MKIFVAGATGRVGQILIKQLAEKGHTVYAGARREEEIEKTEKIQPVHMNLHSTVAELSKLLSDAEAVYFVAGSRGNDLLQTDLNGAVKLMEAANQAGIARFIHLSALHSLVPEQWPESIPDYYVAKFFSDKWLIDQTDLDYTIIQPGSLEETIGSGKISTNITGFSKNSIENVATVLAEVLDKPNTIKKLISMGDGDTPIAEAIKNIK